jgi:hypothetical protein
MSGRWLAQRRDDGQTLTAPGPEELRELITEDYGAQPVSREAALAPIFAAGSQPPAG